MPTVLTVRNIRVVIYPNDHPPPHVHAISGDLRAKFELNCPGGPVRAVGNTGLRRAQVNEIGAAVAADLAAICAKWSEIHGRV